MYHIRNLNEKANLAQRRKHDVLVQQFDKLKIHLLPENELQERVINITYFLNKYGFELIDKLFDELELFDFNHQFVYLT
jgi:uncharacterized protein YllA (UPF0747 family)